MIETLETGSTPIAAVVSETLVRIVPDATVYEVADVLSAEDIGAVAVADDTQILGVVSERDVAHAVAARRDLAQTRAIDIAHTQLIWCDVNATVASVASEMLEQWVRHVLVEDGGQAVGIVSVRDLLGVYAAANDADEPDEADES